MVFDRRPPVLDMSPDGRFRDQAPLTAGAPPIVRTIGRSALLAALLAGGLALASLALWFALILIPVAIGAALVAWIAFHFGGRQSGGVVVRFGALDPHRSRPPGQG